ncbi:MAG: amidase, partial [Bdellovibrio sp.]
NVDLNEFYQQSRSEGFGPEVKRRIILGTYCLSSGYYDAYYKKASQVRSLLQRQFLDAFRECDVMLSPVATSPAFRLGDRIKDPLTMYLNDIFTVSTNLAGLPGLSIPCAFSSGGLPIGLQLQAPHFEEQRILNVALHLQEAFQMYKRRPHGFE